MKRWAILCGLAIILIVVLADTRRLGFLGFVYDIPYGDKVGHFVLFGLLSLLVNLAMFEVKPRENKKLLAIGTGLILAMLIGFEEISQRWVPSRTFSLVDLAASYLGVVLFSWVALKLEHRRARDA